MSKLSPASVERLVTSKEVYGNSVYVTFRCPDTGVEALASAAVRTEPSAPLPARSAAAGSLDDAAGDTHASEDAPLAPVSARRALGKLKRALTSTVAASHGLREAHDAGGADVGISFSSEAMEEATLNAFITVRANFRWSDTAQKWVGGKAPTCEFQRRLLDSPVTGKIDQAVLARVVLELAHSDGVVSHEELLFVSEFLTPLVGSLEPFLREAPLGPAELSLTSEGARASIVMMAWACAMCDEHVDDAESTRLAEIANGFGITEAESTTLRADAQQFLMQQALAEVYVDGVRNESAFDEVTFVAEAIGVKTEDVDSLDASYREAVGAP